jgi:TRAP-type mannitol/chloroaromatic compound transport system permease small subunit
MSILKQITETIDSIIQFMAKIFGIILIIPLIFSSVYDVSLRSFFRIATEWAYDITWMAYAALILIGIPYCFQKNAHVRLDYFLNRIPSRQRAIIECFYLVAFVFPLIVVILKYSIPYAWQAWVSGDRSQYTMWRPYLAPIKTVLPLSFFLLSLQVVSSFIKKITYAIKGVEI